MDRLAARKVRYYIGLHYPLHVTLSDVGFHGTYPDLPGCGAKADDPTELYAAADQVRREWIAARVFAGENIPMPNTHLKEASPRVSPIPAPTIESTPWAQATSVQATA